MPTMTRLMNLVKLTSITLVMMTLLIVQPYSIEFSSSSTQESFLMNHYPFHTTDDEGIGKFFSRNLKIYQDVASAEYLRNVESCVEQRFNLLPPWLQETCKYACLAAIRGGPGLVGACIECFGGHGIICALDSN